MLKKWQSNSSFDRFSKELGYSEREYHAFQGWTCERDSKIHLRELYLAPHLGLSESQANLGSRASSAADSWTEGPRDEGKHLSEIL